jgi:hypothetical protein
MVTNKVKVNLNVFSSLLEYVIVSDMYPALIIIVDQSCIRSGKPYILKKTTIIEGQK